MLAIGFEAHNGESKRILKIITIQKKEEDSKIKEAFQKNAWQIALKKSEIRKQMFFNRKKKT